MSKNVTVAYLESRKLIGSTIQIFLVNGVGLTGKITSYDEEAILLDTDQLVRISGIVTINPSRKR